MTQRIGLLLVPILCALVYANSLDSPFVFDDVQNILSNRHVRLIEITPAALREAAFESPLERPVASLSFALNYRAGGYAVRGYHLVNVAIHALNGLLVLALAGILLAKDARVPSRARPAAALFAALVFVAHPVQTQAVSYVVQRMTGLATLLYLLAFWLWVLGRHAQARRRRCGLWSGALAAWLLALGSKEIAVALPATLLLYEGCFVARWSRAWRKQGLAWLAFLLVLSAALGLVFVGGQPIEWLERGYGRRDFTLGERLFTQPRVLVFYLSLVVLPLPSRLNLVHAFPASQSWLDPITTLLSLLALAALAGLAVLLARRERLVSFAVAWFFVHQVVESTILPLEMIYEHRLYLPMVGLALLGSRLLFAAAPFGAAVALATAVVVALGAGTALRNEVWRDRVALWSDVVAKNPASHRPRNNLGIALESAGRYEEAAEELREGLRLAPDNAALHDNLARVLERRGRSQEALVHFREALRLDPDNAATHTNLGVAYLRQGRLDEAVARFEKALELDPGYAEVRYNLGLVAERRGRGEEAAAQYREALRLRPDFAEAHNNLGMSLKHQGQRDTAMRHYREALRLRPEFAEAHNNLGVALAAAGRPEEAERHYREALRLDPDYALAHNNLGVTLARQGRLDAAVRSLEEALARKPGYEEARRNLAQAQRLRDGARAE
jgi:Flp pilus assembly protein TadD/heme/copper-type cytochrome/quinol oxidase subunit 3